MPPTPKKPAGPAPRPGGGQGKSALMAKYGVKLDNAVKTHAADETDYGFVQLPPGINNGVAQLEEAYFKEYEKDVPNAGIKKGDYFFRASAVMLEPETVLVDGVETKVAGLHTSIMEPVCDTKNREGKVTTQEEHIDRILNHMRKLGGEEFTRGAGGGELEALAEALTQAKPYFKVRTSVRAPRPGTQDKPGVWENWDGARGLENYVPPDAAAEKVDDDTTAPAPAPRAAGSPPNNRPPTRTTNKAPDPDPADQPGEYSDQEDLDSLATRADAEDQEAAARLTEAAEKAGIDVSAHDNWASVVEALKGGGGEEGEDPAEEEFAPKKGDVFYYKEIDARTKKPIVDARTKKPRKGIEVEVVSVDAAKKTVKVKKVDDGKPVAAVVTFDELLGEP